MLILYRIVQQILPPTLLFASRPGFIHKFPLDLLPYLCILCLQIRTLEVTMATFTCWQCGETKPIQTEGGTGYARVDTPQGEKIVCYDCCAVRDRIQMVQTGRITLYLTRPGIGSGQVANWPGTLHFPVHQGAIKTGRHNIAGKRYDVWFTGPDGKPWHGVQYGDNTQICHCRRVKR